jgi:trigger factor
MMKKRILTAILIGILILSMTGCAINRELSNDYIIIHQYRGLEVVRIDGAELEVTEDDVESRIQTELMQGVEHRDITERPARDGDLVVIDFTGSIDGQLFEGGSLEDHSLHLGTGAFIGPYGDYRGFEEQIVGRHVGDNFDIEVQFPHDYSAFAHGAEHLDGAVATFNITLHSITESIFPELTDEWVQANSEESATVDEFREEVRNRLEEDRNLIATFNHEQEVFIALMDHVEIIQIPQEIMDREIEMLVEMYRNMAEMEGLEFEVFLQLSMGIPDEAMFIELVAENAEESVAVQLAIDLIMESENLQLSEKEIHQRIEQIATLGGMSAEEYVTMVGEEMIRSMINRIRVVEFLMEHAEFVEREESDIEAPSEEWSEEWPEEWEDLEYWEGLEDAQE